MKRADNIAKIMELEAQIQQTIKQDNGAVVHFEFSTISGKINKGSGFKDDEVTMVQAFTYNANSEEFFLLYSAIAEDKVKALEMILNYCRTHKKDMKSYTVRWMRKRIVGKVGDELPASAFDMQVSFFYCENPQDVLDKFYAGKDENHYEIYELKLNPMS